MNYKCYSFTARIELQNISAMELKDLKLFCRSLFEEYRSMRRSPKFWTRCSVTHFIPDSPNCLKSFLLFEIHDANSVRNLKSIEGRLKEEATRYKRKVCDIYCTHRES